jgi:hypothetical protein
MLAFRNAIRVDERHYNAWYLSLSPSLPHSRVCSDSAGMASG